MIPKPVWKIGLGQKLSTVVMNILCKHSISLHVQMHPMHDSVLLVQMFELNILRMGIQIKTIRMYLEDFLMDSYSFPWARHTVQLLTYSYPHFYTLWIQSNTISHISSVLSIVTHSPPSTMVEMHTTSTNFLKFPVLWSIYSCCTTLHNCSALTTY